MSRAKKTIGSLYKLKPVVHAASNVPRFCFIVDGKIDNRSWWEERLPVEFDQLLVLISHMDLTLESRIGKFDSSFMVGQTLAGAPLTKEEDYDFAENIWEESKCLPGSAFLTPGGRLIWISDIDLPHFEEIEL